MSSIEAKLEALHDREMIRDCLFRYCRGIDRADEAALRSAYWPDGTDCHGPYQGSASGFIEWALRTLPSIERGIHQIHNILIELRGAEAAVETYFTALQRQPGADGALADVHMAGRYLDRFEKRGEEWRVADRLVVFDLVSETPARPGSEAERFGRRTPIGGRWPDDSVYRFLGATVAVD
ncbi:nuclear transport factor 2 family protein [Sphingomonas colocasiae]|uniref:Nuclear transport factor 2 family protein n=1 Tax=Sphingomonas colocasiae TaxID=1848973 RepID=A0ABS7PMY5_9SPHN|nr:nuclear transport factor 2 family protein [Sphingomonas colocasiae]MBY8822628.1 nuclear transport factor 2 family protein [Sphingomonas colocasiae]